jgi:1,4-alpha-glucan branching enzyme
MRFPLLSLFLFIIISLSYAQDHPSISPQFFNPEEEITITYDVTSSSLSTLSEAYLWMWLPEVGIDAPSNINPASSNTDLTSAAKFTKSTQEGRTYFSITLTLINFLDVEASQVTKVGMILKGNDWADGQTSDHITEVSNGFSAALQSPSGNYGFYEAGESIAIKFATSQAATIEFLVDGSTIETLMEVTTFNTTHNIMADGSTHTLEIKATAAEEVITEKYSYTTTPVVKELPLPENASNGFNYNVDGSVTLVLEAPKKGSVFVIGSFNDWSLNNDYLMRKDQNKFWLTINELNPDEEYQFQYLVDGAIKIADPYSTKIASEFDDPQVISENRYPGLKPYPSGETTEAVSILKINKQEFNWTEQNFSKPKKEDLVIYELLIRDFTGLRTIEAVREKLDYLEGLGINAIELMPVMEFEGNLSWGYNPYAMLAFDKFYGTESDFKTFVNEAHSRGIAVILDIALNHQFGRNSLVRLYNEGLYAKPTSDNPWFNVNAKHDFNVGYDMNHESLLSQSYVDKVIQFWIEEYHVDGYRYDLSKGFTQKFSVGDIGKWGAYDESRITLLKRMADKQWSVDATSYVILEHFADNSEERELANYGMLLWGNHNHDFSSLAKGNNRNISSLYYQSRGWDNPYLVGYMESHDEERVAFELNKSSFDLATKMQRLKLNAAFFFMVPGPKMLWQFGEFAYDEELNNDRLGVKPTHWEYLEEQEKQQLFQVYQSLIKLKTRSGLLNKDNFSWSAGGTIKWLRYQEQDVNFTMLGNFGKSREVFDQKIFSEGTWYDYFTGKEIIIDYTNEEFTFPLAAGEFRLLVSKQIENYVADEFVDNIVLSKDARIANKLTVYPNPVNSTLTLLSKETFGSFNLTDMMGKTYHITARKLPQAYLIDLKGIPDGIYLFTAQKGQQLHQEKIIIKN